MKMEALPWVLVLALVLALQAMGLGEALEYRRALAGAEPWRMLSGHLVHLSWRHALVNGIALLLLDRLAAPWLSYRTRLLTLPACLGAVSLGLVVALPEVEWYRGLSGALHAYFFAAVVAGVRSSWRSSVWLPGALLAGGLLKVLLEQPASFNEFPIDTWLAAPVVPQAHLAGAIAGIALGMLLPVERTANRKNQG